MAMRKYSATEVFTTIDVYGSSINYDTSTVLVTSNESGVMNIYMIPLLGGKQTQLTHSVINAIVGLSWFPSDNRILYSSNIGGNELDHIFVRECDGQVTDITCGDTIKAKFIGWHQCMQRFYILTNERDSRYFDLYEYSSSSYKRRLVFQNDTVFSIDRISPDGRWTSLVETISYSDSNIYLIDLELTDTSPRLITQHQGRVRHACFTFSPDSQLLIYSTNEYSEFKQAWSMNLYSHKKAEYYKANWDVSSVVISNDSSYRIISTNEDGVTKIYVTNMSSNEAIRMINLPLGNVMSVHISSDNRAAIFNINSDTSSTNVYSYVFSSNTVTKLTDTLGSLIEENELVESEVVRYLSFDGVEIPGILYKPKNAGPNHKVPVLIWVHGGPGGQSRRGFRAEVQHLVSNEYGVFAVNNRGSSGYGKTFFDMDVRQHGKVDLFDIVHGKKYLQCLPWVKESQIGIIGRSYGGYLTLAAMAFTDEFKVGIDIFGVANWTRTINSIPLWMELYKNAIYEKMGHPENDAERHRAISPLFHADKINKPVLVVQGANDPRVLQIESDEIVAVIKKNNVPVEYLLFSDEGHGLKKKSNQIVASDSYLTFIRKYLP